MEKREIVSQTRKRPRQREQGEQKHGAEGIMVRVNLALAEVLKMMWER